MGGIVMEEPVLPTDVSAFVGLEAAFSAMVDVEGDLSLVKYRLRRVGAIPEDSRDRMCADLEEMRRLCVKLQEGLNGHRIMVARRIREDYE